MNVVRSENIASSPDPARDGSSDSAWAKLTLEYLDSAGPLSLRQIAVLELSDSVLTSKLNQRLLGSIHSCLEGTDFVVLRSLPTFLQDLVYRENKLRPPAGFFPVLHSTTSEMVLVSNQLPLFVDSEARMYALVGGRTMVRHRPIPESDPVQAKIWLMRELLGEFYRIAESGLAVPSDADLDARRKSFQEEVNPELKSGKAAVLAGTLAKYIENSLEKLQRNRLGYEDVNVSQLILESVDRAWAEVLTLLPFVRLSGGPRGAIRDIDGLLAAEFPEVMKAFGSGIDFTAFGILSKRGDTKLEILVVGRIMHEILRAAECAESEGGEFLARRDELEKSVKVFTEAALQRVDSDPRDGFPDYDHAFVNYRAAHRALMTLLRPDDFDSERTAVSHLNAGLDLIHGMVVLRRAMPIRVSVFLAISAGSRLTRAMLGLGNLPILGQESIQKELREFNAKYQARLRERFLDSDITGSAAAMALAEASDRLSGRLDLAPDQGAPLVCWVRDCQAFMLEAAQAVSGLSPLRGGRIRPQRQAMLQGLRTLMSSYRALGVR